MAEKEKKSFKLELKDDRIKLDYKNLNPLTVLKYLCEGIVLNLQDTLTIEEICDLTKNYLVRVNEHLKDSKDEK